MKKLLFVIFLLVAFQSQAQRFPSIDSLQTYILKYFRNSTVETFTNLRGQNIVYGTTEFLEDVISGSGVDSIWIVDGGSDADTLRYRRWSVTYTAGLITGGGGTVSSVFGRTGAVTALEADYSAFYPLLSGTYNDPTWLNQLAWSKITGAPSFLTYHLINGGVNVGSQAELFKDTLNNKLRFRTAYGTNGVIVTQETDNVKFEVDSLKYATKYSLDTAKANIRAEMSFEGVTFGTVAQRLALDTSTLAEGHEFYQTDQLRGKYEFSSEMGWRFIGAPEMYVVNDQFQFEAGAVGSQHTASVSGTAAVARFLPFASTKYDSLSNRGSGIWEMASGTTTTGYAALWTNASNFGVLRNSHFYSEARIWIDSLSTPTESYLLQVGVKARGSIPTGQNEALFYYSDTTASGVWMTLVTRGDGVAFHSNTGVTATTGWVRLGIEWYSNVPTTTYGAKFYINDVLVATTTITSTLTEGGSHVTSANIRKIAGTTNRQIFFDYFNCYNLNKN